MILRPNPIRTGDAISVHVLPGMWITGSVGWSSGNGEFLVLEMDHTIQGYGVILVVFWAIDHWADFRDGQPVEIEPCTPR